MIVDPKKRLLQDDLTGEVAEYSQELWGGRNFWDMPSRKFHVQKKNLPRVPEYRDGKLNILHLCETHGLVMVHNNRFQSCPLCSDERWAATCEKCGAPWDFTGRRDQHKGIKLCRACIESSPGWRPGLKASAIMKCSIHTFWIRNNPRSTVCPACKANMDALCPDKLANLDDLPGLKSISEDEASFTYGDYSIIHRKCNHCGIWFNLNAGNKDYRYCSLSCSSAANSGPIVCEKHGPQAKSLGGNCLLCIAENPAVKETRSQHYKSLSEKPMLFIWITAMRAIKKHCMMDMEIAQLADPGVPWRSCTQWNQLGAKHVALLQIMTVMETFMVAK